MNSIVKRWKKAIILFYFIFLSGLLAAQSLPDNLHFEEAEHRLTLSAAESTGFYDESVVEPVNLEFYDGDYWEQLHQYYNTETYVPAKLTYKGEEFDSIGVQFKGQTSYRQPVKLDSEKLSFGIKLDQYIGGQEIDGYATLNFNNAWLDPSFMKEVTYAHLARKHIPAVRGNFIHLYLNGEDWGLYPNIQQLNNDFLKEWFMNNNGIRWRADVPAPVLKSAEETGPNWGDGTAALNYLGQDTTLYQQYYTLKSSEVPNPWDYLVKVCEVLNNTPIENLHDSIRKYINLDATLWFLATEILFSDDDSYVHKGKMDYYLYWDEETGLMNPLEFDGNTAMGIRNVHWDLFYNETDVNYPLLNRLLQVPEIRQRYIAHAKTILDDSFGEPAVALVDQMEVLIEEQVRSDPKITIPFLRFKNSADSLKGFIEQRNQFIRSDPEMNGISPTIENTKFSVNEADWEAPDAGQPVVISATANHPSGIKEVNLFYGTGFFGNFEKVTMEGDGSMYTAWLDGFNPGDYVRFYIEAVASDKAGTRSYSPAGAEHDVFLFRINISSLVSSEVVINELMASNDASFADKQGEFDDWLELYNSSLTDVPLDGYYLSDNAGNLLKWAFPDGTIINANGYLVVWADEDEQQPGLHANFKLSASGEELFLINNQGQIADQVYFTAQTTDVSYGRLPNGDGYFQQLNPTPNRSNQLFLTNRPAYTQSDEFIVYPNPATNIIHLKYDNHHFQMVAIYDMLGKEIFSTVNTDLIDISRLTPGLYILKADYLSAIFEKKSQ